MEDRRQQVYRRVTHLGSPGFLASLRRDNRREAQYRRYIKGKRTVLVHSTLVVTIHERLLFTMTDVVNSNSAKLRISPTLEINELVSKARAEGKHVIHLGFGEATFPIQQDVLQAHRDASSETSYMPVAGIQALRDVCFLQSLIR